MAAVPAASATAALLAETNNTNTSASSSSGNTSFQQQHQLRVSNLKARSWTSISAYSFSAIRLDRSFTRKFDGSYGSRPTLWKSPVNEVAVDGSSNAAAVSAPNLEVSSSGENEAKPNEESASPPTVKESSISAFMGEVANLVKLVDSRDIMELQLKQQDCEILIRKKEALPQPPSPPPPVMVHSPYPAYAPPPPAQAAVQPAPSSALVPSGPSAPAQSAPPVKSGQSEHPSMKCPMAGMFYRSSAPGEPTFVKVGDKVQKGQIVCIVEAMKLMNEIEADQSGTIVDILVEDGKPVAIDTPLFVIKP
eukprot:Gb_13172 [translate_table: standard]